jgi:hypothetical protein
MWLAADEAGLWTWIGFIERRLGGLGSLGDLEIH